MEATGGRKNISEQIGITILIPCFQEENNIPELVTRIIRQMEDIGRPWELILVDDGSTDSTWQVIQSFSEKDTRIKGLRHATNEGIAASWQSGLQHTLMDWVLTMDADLQFAPEEIVTLIDEMKSGEFDLVQGKRTKRLDSKYRTFLSAILSHVLKVLFNLPFHDVKSGFVLYKKEAFARILEAHAPFHQFENWIIVAASSHAMKISQVPITVYPRKAGQSHIQHPFVFGLRSLWEICLLFVRFRIKRKT